MSSGAGSEFGGIGTHSLRETRAPRVRLVDLVVESGPDAGRRLRIAEGIARIGTAPNVDLRLTDPTVSRFHCEIHVRTEGDTVRVLDTSSTNGTLVGAVNVHDAELTETCTLVLGSTTVRVEIAADSVELALPARDSFGPLMGASVAMRRVYGLLERVAPSELSALVTGETGTGKELVARAIHEGSPRARGPFVVLDCAALPPHLVESELFGHARGAFSGALADRPGLFEEAHGGTLFLDELGELPVQLQPKLLRVLETRTLKRVGTNRPRTVDVRIVAATNRRLSEEVNRGTFREDLYYRIAVVEVRLPPLRERGGDVAMLARLFWERANAHNPVKMPASLVSTVTARGWPGNVRELRSFVERAAALEAIASLPAQPADQAPFAGALAGSVDALIAAGVPFKEARRHWTRAYTDALLERTAGNVTHAAELGGISRRFLQRLVERAGDDGDDQGKD